MPPKQGLLRKLPPNVIMLGVVSFLTDASSEIIYPLLPYFFTGLVPVSVAAIYIGLMDGLAETTASFMKIFAGWFSDRSRQRKPLTVLGYGISTLVRPLIGLASAGWHVVLLRTLDRVGKGIRTSPRDALISDSIGPEDRGLAYSFHRMLDHGGAFVGPLFAALVLYFMLGRTFFWGKGCASADGPEMLALRWLFLVAFIPGLACMVVLIRKVHDATLSPAPETLSVNKQAEQQKQRLPGRFYFYLAGVTLFTLGNSSDLFLIFYAQTRFDLGLGHAILLWTVLHIAKIVFSLPGGRLSDHFGRRLAIVSGWLIYILVYLAIPWAPNPWWIGGLIFVYGAYYGLSEGAERALVADFVMPSQRGLAFGFYHGAVGLAALPASLVFGLFWAKIGPQNAFRISAGLAAAAALLLFIVLSGKSRGVNNG